MFELLANYKDLQTISWTQESAKSKSGPYGCMPTYSNWNCVVSPAPSASRSPTPLLGVDPLSAFCLPVK